MKNVQYPILNCEFVIENLLEIGHSEFVIF